MTPSKPPIPARTIPANRPQDSSEIAAALTTLSTETRLKLKKAAATGNMDEIEALIEQIQGHQPTLADELARLAYEFDYDQIVALLGE